MQSARIFLSPPKISPREYELVTEALDSNYVAPVGPMLEAFEAELSAYTGLDCMLATASGTAALHLALRVLGVAQGDRVIVPSLTFIGSVTPILFQNAEPVFVDCVAESWLIDPDILESTLARYAKTDRPVKAVIGVDLYGQPCDPALYRPICERYGAEFILDSAESMGSFINERHAGKGARFACYSFNGNKIITTSGGGALGSDEPELVAKARNLAQQARVPVAHYEHEEYGYNYRLSNILAAIGRAQLETLEERVAQRRALFERYVASLGDLNGVSFMPEIPGARGNRWLSVALLAPESGLEPETVRVALEADNIESRSVWKPMHLQPVFKDAEMVGGAVSESLLARGLCLPSGAQVDEAVVARITARITQLARG